jgi:hypothetical protein
MLSILAATMEFSDMNKQSRSVSISFAGKFGEHSSKDFVLNKGKVEDEKRERLAITPRWFGKPTFQESTARNTLDFMRAKTVKPEGRKSIFSVNKMKRSSSSSPGGRASF